MPSHAAISAATAATHTVVAAVTGHKIRVLAYLIVAAGAVVATFRSGASTDLTGAMTLATGVPNSGVAPTLPFDGVQPGVFETAAGEALSLNLGGAVQVSGWVVYETVK